MTSIQWTDETWNPVTGCSRVSEGCRHCYIERTPPFRMAGRTLGDPVQLHPDRLDQPLHWTKPRRVFVNSLSDLFHEEVPFPFIDLVFAAMAQAPQHSFQVLTKRPTRMREWFDGGEHLRMTRCFRNFTEYTTPAGPWPLPNVWLGISVEDQQTADERIPILLQTPAAVRFVSAEPLLGPVDLATIKCTAGYYDLTYFDGPGLFDRQSRRLSHARLNWVIVGGESGPQARPCDIAWIRSIVRQCQAAKVPCFLKQLGSRPYVVEGSAAAREWYAFDGRAMMDDCGSIHCKDKKGGDPAEWPEDLRVREWPR